jgi:hypothetical protein
LRFTGTSQIWKLVNLVEARQINFKPQFCMSYYADCWTHVCAVLILNMERGEGGSKETASLEHGLYEHWI